MLRALFVVLIAAAAVPASAAPPRPDVLVESVVVSAASEGEWVRIGTNGPVAGVSVDLSGSNARVLLRGARLGVRVQRGPAGRAVRAYRVEAAPDGVVLVLELEPGMQVEAVPERGASRVSLLVSAPRRVAGWGGMRVPPPGGAAAARPTSRRSPPAAGPSAPAAPAPSAAPEASARPAASRRTPARRAPERPAAAPPAAAPSAAAAPAAPAAAGTGRWRLDTVVLDAGHGGRDIGAAYHGVREKDVTLGIVRHLGPMLERELGVRVVYTRTDDRFLELRERGQIANRAGGKLFVSVHANAAANGSARGTETFFLAPHRSADARAVMERENGVIALESLPELYDRYFNQGDILQQMAMSAYQEESQALAGLVEAEFSAQGRRSRGVKQAGFLVLWAASMPSVLVEVGFVSNADEARLLGSSAGQEQIARDIFRGIAAHKARYERGMQVAVGTR